MLPSRSITHKQSPNHCGGAAENASVKEGRLG